MPRLAKIVDNKLEEDLVEDIDSLIDDQLYQLVYRELEDEEEKKED